MNAGRGHAAGALVLALLLAAVPACAADDAGTQSVFADGAGNRALAMGGAFVATADDASAVLWNPAGLGRVTRSTLEGVQSGDLGLGMSESYASLAMPHWRWGTGALAMRHFGVSGIEQRDDRNVLLADDLGDSEFEIALGYGRSVSDAWELGGAVKLQHHSLAGFSGSGLGVDLGLEVRPAAALGLDAPWAQGLRYGLSLRNAVAPSIRLDRESVPDTHTLRTGLGWGAPLASGRALLAEVDLEKADGRAWRANAGAEWWPFPVAALRAGLHHGSFTSGLGLRWRQLAFDYAFVDEALAATHRAGISFRFGPTTAESRDAFARREDAKAEQRLADAFQQRQAEQVAALRSRAIEARDAGDFDAALAALAALATLSPGDSAATRIEASCFAGQARRVEADGDFAAAALLWGRALAGAPGDTAAAAGAARCRAESDRAARRTSEIRSRFAAAMDALAGGDLLRAREGFRTVLALEPGDAEAARMLARSGGAITHRASDLAEQAVRAARAGALDESAARLAEARVLDPDAPGVAAAQAELAHARQLAAAAAAKTTTPATGATAAAAAPAGPRLTDREIEELYQRGLAAARAQRSDDALRYWELVWSSRPGYREVATYLKREYLLRGMEAFAAGRLEEAGTQWEQVLRVDPNDERARGYLARARTQAARSREILGITP